MTTRCIAAKRTRAVWLPLVLPMRRTSELRPPDYTKKDDPALLRHGAPDMLVLIKGRRLFVH